MIRPHAYILAGGRSSRFGSDKAFAQLDAKPLVVHTCERLESLTQSVSVVAEYPNKFEQLGLRTIADHTPHLGPLGGMLAAMDDRPHDEPTHDGPILISACDLLVPTQAIEQLLTSWQADDRALARSDGPRWHPFPGLYHSSLSSAIRELIEGPDRSVRALLERFARGIENPPVAGAVDCNTPRDLIRAASGRGTEK